MERSRDFFDVNFTVETVNGIVYLMGIARSRPELDKVTTHAGRNIAGPVQKVISHVRLTAAARSPRQIVTPTFPGPNGSRPPQACGPARMSRTPCSDSIAGLAQSPRIDRPASRWIAGQKRSPRLTRWSRLDPQPKRLE